MLKFCDVILQSISEHLCSMALIFASFEARISCSIAIQSWPENWYAGLNIGCSNQNLKGVEINWSEFECDPLVRVVHGLLRKTPLLMNTVTEDGSSCGDEFQCFIFFKGYCV